MSKWMNGGMPTHCAFCGDPFVIQNNRIEAVRVEHEYVCNTEACVDGMHEELPSFVTKGRKLS